MPFVFFPSAGILAMFGLMIGGGLGVPLGIPPAPEDPVLAQVAPDNVLYYTRWAGMAEPDAESANQVERLMADEEFQAFAVGLQRQLESAAAFLGRNGGAEQAAVAKVLPLFGKTLLTHPTTIFVSNLQLRPAGADIQGALVVRLGESEQQVQAALKTLQDAIFANFGAQTVDIDGTTFNQIRPDPAAPLFTWGTHDGLFILGLGEEAAEGVILRAKTPAPEWLVDLEEKYTLPRRATLTYADLNRLMGLAVPMTGDPQAMEMLDSIGLNQLKSYVSMTGLDDTRFVSRTSIRIVGEPRGLLAMLPESPLSEEDLEGIPEDALAAAAFRADGTAVFETILEMIGLFDPQLVTMADAQLNGLKQGLSIDVRQDLLGSLGDVWQLYTSPGTGGWLTGWTACVSVEDMETLSKVHNKLLGVINGQAFQAERTGLIRTAKAGDLTIHTLNAPDDDFFVAPSWCIADGQFAIALFPQAIKAHFARKEKGSLARVDEVAKAFETEDRPFALGFYDAKSLFRTIYPWMQMGARVAAAEMQSEGLDVDISILPSAYSIERHLRPGVVVKRRTAEGIEIETRQSMPAGTVGATGPVIAAMTFPAFQSSRAASQRVQSTNNLKMIGLAWHNYHDVHQGLPAAFNTDEEGKPLLSWRVHVLPYIGYQDLYNQFRLNEPWSSEHNRKLIRRMPREYKAPGSLSEPGKTNYLGVAGEQGVILGPKDTDFGKRAAIGVRFRDMTDGTSNTLGAVEVNDELAVIWTKPDDYTPDKENPMQGLVGLRPRAFLGLMCDGSVRTISQSTNKQTLQALFTRNGGERIERF
jgi:hypothetical protein